jgi:replicative superfamily II helicase
MAFRGLFIGIDRYASSGIDELTCARRDAVALEALFADTLGGSTCVLADADATRNGIEAAFAELASCCADDTVVIAFSGHGSDTHELVTHDADLADLPNTAIPLDLLQEWFSKIPAQRLVLFLDCCFSGGIGAKVLHVPTKARSVLSTDARLNQLAGAGRIIFTASAATEPAYEDRRYGHGFLTHFLIEALLGAEEAVQSSKLSLYLLLSHVTNRVRAAAALIGRQQNPTMRGSIDGDVEWPVFVAGQKYEAAFPARARARVTTDLSSLASAGFPQALINVWGAAIPALNDLQVCAINDYGLLDGNNVVVSAPTSSGKTMVGELAALRNALERKRALFLLPLKALVADKWRHFAKVYGEFGVRTVEATGETDDITPLLRGQYDIGLLTYEKFSAIALTFPHVLAQVGVIVIDEAQMIADRSRGANLEFLLTLIRMRRREGIEPQIIALSAVIGDTNGLEQWLGARLLRRTERPVPLDEGLLLGDGTFRHIDATTGKERRETPLVQRLFGKGSNQDLIIPLVRKLVAEGQQIIVFRETKSEARSVAKYLAEALGLAPATDALGALPGGDPSRASIDLRNALSRGVAFHNADLEPEERRIVEEEFRRAGSGLRVIAATTTLAMGVNTPASSVIIAGLDHPGDEPYSVAEYKNLVGRAGRLGYAEKGTAYLIALDARAEHDLWRRYVTASPEDLVSRFLDQGTDPRSLIIRVLVSAPHSADGVCNDDILGFLESSFGAFLARRASTGWRWSRADLMTALTDLERYGLVKTNVAGALELTDLGRLAGESAAEVGSIVALVDCLSGLQPEQITDPVLIVAAQTTIEVDQVLFPINKKSTQKEPQLWPNELRGQGIPGGILGALQRGVADLLQATLRAKKAVACLLFVSGRPMNEIEGVMTQFGGAFGGAAGPIRSVSTRTCDLMPVAARIAEILHPTLNLGDRVSRLAVRLTHGVPAAAVDLAEQGGTDLLRGDYRRLAEARLCEPDHIEAATDGQILACVDLDKKKLALVRDLAKRIAERRAQAVKTSTPILDAYVA